MLSFDRGQLAAILRRGTALCVAGRIERAGQAKAFPIDFANKFQVRRNTLRAAKAW